jgi:hypothetical protein
VGVYYIREKIIYNNNNNNNNNNNSYIISLPFLLPPMESKLKALKVADLKDILSKANVSVPAKANKSDLVAKISTSTSAIDVYNRLYPSKTAPPPTNTNDDLVGVFLYLDLINSF